MHELALNDVLTGSLISLTIILIDFAMLLFQGCDRYAVHLSFLSPYLMSRERLTKFNTLSALTYKYNINNISK